MSRIDGWTNWDKAFFRKIFFGDREIVYDFPGRIRFPRQGQANSLTNLAGTSIHQPFWLGGDAPINLMKMTFELDFQPDAEQECFALQRYASICSFRPQEFFAGIWIQDIWYIPGRVAGQTIWQTSRNIAYHLVDIADPTNDYLASASIDGVAQDIITTGSPVAGEVKITPDVSSGSIELPVLSTGTFLELHYPASFFICKADINEEIPDSDDYTLGITMEEHLIARDYNITIP